MKRIKLNIKTSDRGDYTYNIFRDTNDENLPADAIELSQLDPVFEFQEDIMEHTALFNVDVMKVDKNKIPRDGRIPYKLDYKPVISSIHEISIDVITPEGTEEFIIEFKPTFEIDKVTRINALGIESDVPVENFEIINDNIYINYALIDTASELTAKYYIEVVEVFDDDEKIVQGLNKMKSEAHGLSKPIGNFSMVVESVAPESDLTHLEVIPSAGDVGLNYYYRMIAKDPLGNVSEPSNLLATLLTQDPEEISYKLEVNILGDLENEARWTTFATDLKHDELVVFGKKGTENYEKYGKIHEDMKQNLDESHIQMDPSLIDTESLLKGYVPNVWYGEAAQNSFISPRFYAFRLRTIDNLGEESEPTDYFIPENGKVSVDKIVVYKKNVSTETNKQTPITDEDVANGEAFITHIFIKKNGVYYLSEAHADVPLNQEFVDGNKTIIDSTCDYQQLGFKDNDCYPGQIYNYTIYLYDSYEEQSEPIVTVVDNTSLG